MKSQFDADAGEGLKEAFDSLIAEWPGITATKMFGLPSYHAEGTIFAALVTGGVVLTRLPEEKRDQLAGSFGAEPFEANGKTVAKWLQIDLDDESGLSALRPYIQASYDAARNESQG